MHSWKAMIFQEKRSFPLLLEVLRPELFVSESSSLNN